MPVPNRIIIYPKDIMMITGKSERTARRMQQRIRERFHKAEGSLITLEEFCLFTGLREEAVLRYLN